jgi:DNA-binding MarR family transcriptional regulator
MSEEPSYPDVRPLADINQIIHAPARLTILAHLYVVESADYVFLMRTTGLTWGNLSCHLGKLEDSGYITIIKGYRGKKPHSTIRLSDQGRAAFRQYKQSLQKVLNDLPD